MTENQKNLFGIDKLNIKRRASRRMSKSIDIHG